MAGNDTESSDSNGLIVDDNVIRIQLKKPCHRKWELRTRNKSPGIRFPTIQLFDCEGNLLIETNDDNISIKSSDFDAHMLKSSQSLRERDRKYVINKEFIKKRNTISGDQIYTRVHRTPFYTRENSGEYYSVQDNDGVTNIPNKYLDVSYNNSFLSAANSLQTTPLQSDCVSEISSYKSSDNEGNDIDYLIDNEPLILNGLDLPSESKRFLFINRIEYGTDTTKDNKERGLSSELHKSKSLQDTTTAKTFTKWKSDTIPRSKSGIVYKPPLNRVSFLNTYLKSLHARTNPNPDWLACRQQIKKSEQNFHVTGKHWDSPKFGSIKTRFAYKTGDNTSDNDFINIPTDVAADYEMKKRLKMYRRGMSEIEPRYRIMNLHSDRRSHSVIGTTRLFHTSSSESVDEADFVLNRLKRRILKNKLREKKRSIGAKYLFNQQEHFSGPKIQKTCRYAGDSTAGSPSHLSQAMGSNISQHSAKGLKGRRARSSGDLCNGDTKSQTESSVCGSVVGDVMGWNRSLPNHLDGNRHLADYSRVNDSYGDFATYNRSHPKGGRGLRYRVSKSGSDAEPVWKLQDQGFDQGYGSERSPEEDYVPRVAPAPLPAVSLEAYEAELRVVYPFITDENTFTVVVEKDGRGLGMSVCGGGGLVRIRRLYPPQPAWRTGRLAPRDLLLAANGVPLAGLTTYEALEVLRTAPMRVELRVCRPPPDVLESVTPPDPPTPPTRTPHPPLDPLNCHPMHARLSQTTSSATTSSSEGRGRRDASPERDRRDLHLSDLDRPPPVYDVQYGDDGSVEFDIIMTKVNGSLGFTLRKEDHSALGHYVRALVREPALSDGRIQPGDRIVAVNETSMSNMSHTEAVSYLRACGAEVRLRLYRDHAATPVSPMSPREDAPTDSDAPLNRPKPPLRAEAVSMLCDLAARRLTPDHTQSQTLPAHSHTAYSGLSPRKLRRLTKDNNHYETPNVPPHGYELNNLDNETLDAPNVYQEEKERYNNEPMFPVDSDEPVSMPVALTSDDAKFKHANPIYQSAVLHTSSNDGSSDSNKNDNNLKKWKGVALSPDNERKTKPEPSCPPINKENHAAHKENVRPEVPKEETITEPTIVTVELNRGWNSRLGFSVQSHPESGQSYISAVYTHSVAARDGRLRQGDVILQVNDENVTSMKTPEVIDLLRILRGSICITVLRPPNP